MKRPLSTYRPFGPFVSNSDASLGFFSSKTDRQFDVQTDEETIRIYTPTETSLSESQASEVESKVMSMINDEVTVRPVKSGALSSLDASSKVSDVTQQLPHETLDIIEANIKRRVELESRSTVMGVNTDKSVCSVFEMGTNLLDEDELDKIEELGSFVTELDLDVSAPSGLMVDTQTESVGHTDIDVIEVLSSRVSFPNDVSILANKLVLK